MMEQEIPGFRVRVVPTKKCGVVSLEWCDHQETDDASSRGESHLMGVHDIEVPVRVLITAMAMLKRDGKACLEKDDCYDEACRGHCPKCASNQIGGGSCNGMFCSACGHNWDGPIE